MGEADATVCHHAHTAYRQYNEAVDLVEKIDGNRPAATNPESLHPVQPDQRAATAGREFLAGRLDPVASTRITYHSHTKICV